MGCLTLTGQLGCTACSLSAYRIQVVPDHGCLEAEIAFVAEAPGGREDAEGYPLVGPAGQRFTTQLKVAGLDRDDVWLANTVKCRPPGNDIRKFPDAVATCPDLWLWKGLAKLDNLKVIVAMGATAASLWFGRAPIGSIVGVARMVNENRIDGRELVVVASYHPSYSFRGGGTWNNIDDSIVASIKRAMEAVA